MRQKVRRFFSETGKAVDMAVRIAVGGEFFDKIRESGAYYVDKTELLYELFNNTENTVTLFTRPRRFGKTLTMTMMECFFDINRDSREAFKGLAVTAHEEFCRSWMNQYPVLFLTLKDVEGLSFSAAFDMLKNILSRKCSEHVSLADCKDITERDKRTFIRLLNEEPTPSDVKSSLDTLMRMMQAAYGKPVVLLIDEYDVPLAKANENGYSREMLDVIRGMLSTALKTNSHLKFAVLTGCLRISKESIFTGVNNFACYSVLDNRFSRYFGFTHEEVDRLLVEVDLADKTEVFKDWYDGYVIGNTPMYCPWDVASHASALVYDRCSQPLNYWKNTSGNGILRDFIFRTDLNVSGKFEILMNGGTIRQTISDGLTYDTLYDTEDNIWSILLMTGYLTKADPRQTGNTVDLRIPNAEIASIFEDSVVALFKASLDKGRQTELMKALWNGDVDGIRKAISDFLWDTISYHNYHENFYQAFIAGIFTGVGYGVQTDHEQGLGRSDIVLTDRRNRRAILIETKKSDSEDCMEKDCEEANAPILKQKYADSLKGYTTVLCYGIAFFRKSALVRKLEWNSH